jgi:hypothetical protein
MLSVVAQALLLYISCVQVRIFVFLAMLTRAASGRSRSMKGILFLGEENVLDIERTHFSKL